MLLTKLDEAKISDVGLGKLIYGEGTVATQMGSFMWASPEQLTGGIAGISSDIYRYVLKVDILSSTCMDLSPYL